MATNENARKTRERILGIPSTVKDLATALEAANTLLDLAKQQALSESEIRDEAEIVKLKESYGATGSKLATGGNKALKELEKEQKTRSNRLIKDFLDSALLEIALESKHSKLTLNQLDQIQKTRYRIQSNAGLELNLFSMMCGLLSA